MIFPIGEPNTAYAQYFTGNSYLAPVSREQVNISNVTFEPRCRNNWHIHKATKGGGQMLISVAGRGWYQEEGKPAIEILPGTVIHIPANVKHCSRLQAKTLPMNGWNPLPTKSMTNLNNQPHV